MLKLKLFILTILYPLSHNCNSDNMSHNKIINHLTHFLLGLKLIVNPIFSREELGNWGGLESLS